MRKLIATLCLTLSILLGSVGLSWSSDNATHLDCFIRDKLAVSISINLKTEKILHINHLTEPKRFSADATLVGRFLTYYQIENSGNDMVKSVFATNYRLNRETLMLNVFQTQSVNGKKVRSSEIDLSCKIIDTKNNKF